MSEVISFRLNRKNPREAKTYEVLKNRQRQGYSIRQTITEALLRLDEYNPDSVRGDQLDEINEALIQLRQLVEHLQNDGSISRQFQDSPACNSRLTDNFIASIREAVKPGKTID